MIGAWFIVYDSKNIFCTYVQKNAFVSLEAIFRTHLMTLSHFDKRVEDYLVNFFEKKYF